MSTCTCFEYFVTRRIVMRQCLSIYTEPYKDAASWDFVRGSVPMFRTLERIYKNCVERHHNPHPLIPLCPMCLKEIRNCCDRAIPISNNTQIYKRWYLYHTILMSLEKIASCRTFPSKAPKVSIYAIFTSKDCYVMILYLI